MLDVARALRQASWSGPEAAQAEARAAGAVAAAELVKALPLLLERGLASQPAQHRLRIVVYKQLVEQAPHRELFVPFCRALRGADPALRAALLELIPKVNAPEAHGELCNLLAIDDADLRQAAAIVLSGIASPQSLETLTAMVQSREFVGRMEALDAVVPRARHRSVGILVAVLSHGNPRERAHALKWAGDRKVMEKGLAEAAAIAAKGLADAHERVAAQACRSLAQVASEDDFFEQAGRLRDAPSAVLAQAFVESLRNYATPRSLHQLQRALRTGPVPVRLAALDTLEAIGNESVLPALTEALTDKQLQVRTRTTEVMASLSRQGKVDLARTVMWLLRSRDVTVRRTATELVRAVGDPQRDLVPRLLRFLRDQDWWVRERVMDALMEMNAPQLVDQVAAYLQDESPVVRRFAVASLGRIKDARALGPLVRAAMDDTDWWVREDAVLTAASFGDPRVVPYLARLAVEAPELSATLIEALGKFPGPEAVAAVSRMVKDADAQVRLAAVKYLAAHGSPAEEIVLASLEDDPDPTVRDLALATLERWTQAPRKEVIQSGLNLLERMLVEAVKSGADDVMVAPGRPAYIKRLGRMTPFSDRNFTESDVERMLLPTLTDEQRAEFDKLAEVDFSYAIKAHGLRFRANFFRALPGISAVFRVIRSKIPDFETLGLPRVVRTFGDLKNGLVLVGGPTGSGKSTTLAALIDYINRTSGRHVVAIEDPIEVVHEAKQCLINQRETGSHTRSFERALRSTLRQDPDVILVGEMRDLDTIAFAITAAETGHLVFGTVHTVSAENTIDRLLNVFPPGQRTQIRSMLSETLRAVLCQHLVRRRDRPGERVLSLEIMLNNDAIANLIRKDKGFQIPAVIATQREAGMQSMDHHLGELVKAGVIDRTEAYMKAADKKLFEAETAPAPEALSRRAN